VKEMSKLIVELPDELHGELKKKAINDQKTIKEVITELIYEYISSPKNQTSAKRNTGLCGSWEDERTADEIIKDIKTHRRWFMK
jgi:hypothetical protein